MALVSKIIALENKVYFELTGSTADADTGEYVDIFGLTGAFLGSLSLFVRRTAGSTNTIAVSLQGSISPTSNKWTDVIAETDVTGALSEVTFAIEKLTRFYRLYVTTVGSGNTLSIFATLM